MDYLEIARAHMKKQSKAKAREDVDAFWLKEILPRLSRAHWAGRRLPDMTEIERLWDTLAEDCPSPATVEEIKSAMIKAVEGYEAK